MSSYRILFLGDIVGKPGRKAVIEFLPGLIEQHTPRFVIANAENSAGGVGITPDIVDELLQAGVDAITLGNHAFNKREIVPFLNASQVVARPANMAPDVPGRGVIELTKDNTTLLVANLCGRIFLEGYDDPFRELDRIVAGAETQHIFVDFHAEATSEKVAFGWHCDGRVTAVVGTHTHVQTADERILPKGTAYITDAGMCGPETGVIGMDREVILYRFRTGLPARFEVADGPGVICGVVVDVEVDTGRALAMERVRYGLT